MGEFKRLEGIPDRDAEAAKATDFYQVVKRLNLSQESDWLFWPTDNAVAKQIHRIVTQVPSPGVADTYRQLAELNTTDLRPHLLLLLKGFDEGGAHYQISRTLFETLHMWHEFASTPLHPVASVTILTKKQCADILALADEARVKFHANSKSGESAEHAGFSIPVNVRYVYERVQYIFHHIQRHVDNPRKTDGNYHELYYLLESNLEFLARFVKIYNYQESLGPIVENLKAWFKRQSERSLEQKRMQSWEDLADSGINANTIAIATLSFSSELIRLARGGYYAESLLVAAMQFDNHPLLQYHYDAEKQLWYMLFLPPRAFSSYCAAHAITEQTMLFVYGKISPDELIAARLNASGQVIGRLGSLTTFHTQAKHFSAYVIHNSGQKFTGENLLHDGYHRAINARAFSPKIAGIIRDWMLLIGQKTGLYRQAKDNATWLPISRDTWTLADMPVQGILSAKTELALLEIIFTSFTNSAVGPQSLINYMLVLHIAYHDFYGLRQVNEQSSGIFHYIQTEKQTFIDLYHYLSAHQSEFDIDACTLTALCIFEQMQRWQRQVPALFDTEAIKEYGNLLTCRWQRAAGNSEHNVPKNSAEILLRASPKNLPDGVVLSSASESKLWELSTDSLKSANNQHEIFKTFKL